MKHLSIAALVAAAATFGLPASACYKVKVENKTDASLDVKWSAMMCGGKAFMHGTCKLIEDLAPGKSKTYGFGWSTTQPIVTIFVNAEDVHETRPELHDMSVGVSYSLKKGKFKKESGHELIRESAPSCNKHYTITYTQDDMEKDWAKFAE